MADLKITDLTELAVAPATDDWLEIVDKSDTTDSAAGSSRKISVANLTGSSSSDPLDGNAIIAQRIFVR